MDPSPPIEALLFDLGGVLIDIDTQRAVQHWEPLSSLSRAQLQQRFTVDQALRQYESGEIDTAAYVAHLRQEFELHASDSAIVAGWNAILVGEIEPALQAVVAARTHLPCYAFSNTSPAHQIAWSSAFPRVATAFDRLFLSFEIGARKPDIAAFQLVTEAIGKDADRVLFFDDTPANVQGARDAGLQAVQVTDHRDLQRALAGLGVL
jgi:putative hydrolase of the HAD superfamily